MGYIKNRPDSLINQRLPGINAAKIGIISEYSKYLSNYFSKIDYKRILADALESGLIKMKDPETESKRYTSYIPYYG